MPITDKTVLARLGYEPTRAEARIVNTIMQLQAYGGDRVAILTHHSSFGRGSWRDGWSIAHYKDGAKFITDAKAHWADYGAKVFTRHDHNGTWRDKDAAALKAAMEWCDHRYGKRDYVRNRLGDYVEREVNRMFPIDKPNAGGR